MNGIALCSGCHIFWAHKEPTDFTEWITEILGKTKYDLLRIKANQNKPYLDYETLKYFLLLNTTHGIREKKKGHSFAQGWNTV